MKTIKKPKQTVIEVKECRDCRNYVKFEPKEKLMNCIKCGKELINSAICACDKIKLEEKPMEVKCKKCKIGAGGRICGYENSECSGSNYKYFVPMEGKSLDNLVGKFNCINCGKKLIRGESCDCKSEPMEQKKYRALKDYKLPLTQTIVLVKGNIYSSYDLEGFDIDELINQGYIEEVKEDTLESIIDENFIGDEIKKNLKQCIIKQKIELLNAIRSKDEPILKLLVIAIDDKISELQKEIK